MKVEDVSQPAEFLLARRNQVEPEEVVVLEVLADALLVQLAEAVDDEPKVLVVLVVVSGSCLAHRHRLLLALAAVREIVPGSAVVRDTAAISSPSDARSG